MSTLVVSPIVSAYALPCIAQAILLCSSPVASMSAGLSFVYYSTPEASTSEAGCSSPRRLTDASRVKLELRTPVIDAYEAFPGHERQLASSADTRCTPLSNRTLISPSSAFRHSRPATLLPTSRPNTNTAALFSPQYIHPTHHPQQDVLPLLNSSSFTNDLSEPAHHHGTSRPSSELPPPRAPLVSQHAPVNPSTWTSSHPVFTSTSALAAHHGIPQSLPPVPRTTRYLSEKPPAIPSTSTNSDLDFSSLVSGYLNMLSQKPEDHRSEASSGSTMTDDNAAALQAVLEVIQGTCVVGVPASISSNASALDAASPEFQELQEFGLSSEMPGDYSSFLTSPMEDSPFEDMLTTPALGNGDFDYLTSPAIVDADDFGYGSDEPLFGHSAQYAAVSEPIKAAPPVPAVQHPVDFDGMYTMSPDTPSLDPSSLQTSPLATPLTPSLDTPVSAPRRKNAPTGTRKNITPEALVPYDAPIQPRKYVTPSSTSRKAVPAGFAKKRGRSVAFGKDDEDELASEAQLDPNDLDAIEAKRRQNTLAARRSRKRKLEYQRELETSVERLSEDMSRWKRRAETLEAVLRSHGLEVPSESY